MNQPRKVYRIQGRRVTVWLYHGTYLASGEPMALYSREGEPKVTYGEPFLGECPHYANRREAEAALKLMATL